MESLRSPRARRCSLPRVFLAFAIKVPLFPLHTWLPDAHVEAPTAGSVILAGVLLKMGTYGMIRFCCRYFQRRRTARRVCCCSGDHRNHLWRAGGDGAAQPEELVAYSSVSHLGFVVLGIFAFQNISMQGAVFQMLAHGVSTGALFLLVASVRPAAHL